MFTIRFEAHNLEAVDYQVHQCEYYRVYSDGNLRKTVAMFRDGATPALNLDVGDESPFSQAYVTNENGRTVDAIRPMKRGETSEANLPRPPQ